MFQVSKLEAELGPVISHLDPNGQPPLISPGGKRKSRDVRVRSQDWPDIPHVGRIQEQNPEILAQKILETGRQIEQGKIRETGHGGQIPSHMTSQAPHTQPLLPVHLPTHTPGQLSSHPTGLPHPMR